MKHFIIVFIILTSYLKISAQNEFTSELKKVESQMKKSTLGDYSLELLFDKYNCILHVNENELTLTGVSMTYQFVDYSQDELMAGYSHQANITCPYPSQCLYNPQLPAEYQKSGGFFISFKSKADAIEMVNVFNEFFHKAKSSGYCMD